jgi:integrase
MLTERQIQTAFRTVETEITLNDGADAKGTGSLKLVVRRTGRGVTALWFAAWKSQGQRRKRQLGRYPTIPLADARRLFREEISPIIRAGGSLSSKAGGATLEALFTAYCDQREADGTRTVKEIRRVLLTGGDACADGLGRQRLAGDISPADVAAVLAKAFNRGARRQADIQRTYMAAAFNWGIKSTHDYRTDQRGDWGIKYNPVASVPKDAGANRARERNLAADELRALWAGLPGASAIASVVKLLICCGQRVRETLRVDGADIDLAAATWTMPAYKTKGGKRPHTIPLPPQAVAIFRGLIAQHGAGPLFPARAGATAPHIADTSVNQAVKRWTAAVGLAPFIPRDLRRTWKSRTADAGIDRFVRDLIQQHARGDTGSKYYDRADYLPQMRAAMGQWAAWLDAHVTGPTQPVEDTNHE